MIPLFLAVCVAQQVGEIAADSNMQSPPMHKVEERSEQRLFGEFLYWKASSGRLGFTTRPEPLSNGSVIPSKVVDPHFVWSPGFRLG